MGIRKPVFYYCVLAYAITWTLVLLPYFSYRNDRIDLTTLNLLYNFGALGPFLSAIIVSSLFYGRNGMRNLFSTFTWRGLTWKSNLVSLSPIFFLIFGLLIYPLLTGRWFTFADTRRQYHLTDALSYLGWILPFITYSVLEEFGWRGFLLPHLQSKYTAVKATFFLTAVWAIWHLPFFLWRFQFSTAISIGFFFSIFIGAIIITCTYNLSNGSIVSVILFHLTNNLASALDKEYLVVVLSIGFVFLAIYLVWKLGPAQLSDGVRVGNFYSKKPKGELQP